MNQQRLERVDTFKDLGVVVDNKLRFNQHIALTTAKAFAMLGFLKRNTTHFDDPYSLKTLFCALVRSVLEYAVAVWAPFHETQIARIESVQRAFVRYAFRKLRWNDPLRLPPYEQRCALFSLPTLARRRVLIQRLLVFDILRNNIDCSSIRALVQFSVPARQGLRNDPPLLHIPRHRTVYGYHNPLDVCIRRFNDVQSCFNFNVSKCVFKSRISM